MENNKKKKGCGCSVLFFVFLLWAVAVVVFATITLPSESADFSEEISQPTSFEEETEEIEETSFEDETVDTTETDETLAETEVPTEESTDSKEEISENNVYKGRMYEHLTDVEKDVYNALNLALSEGKLDCTIKGVDVSQYMDASYKAYDALYCDHPEYFWINGAWSAESKSKSGELVLEYEIGCYDYWKYVADKKGYIEDTMTAAKKIADEAQSYSSDYEKMKYVHDYLIKTVTYDKVALKELNKSKQRTSNQQSHTAYGALVKGLAVCDGYSKAYQLIMNQLGIECELMVGDAGGPHAWNFVKLDGDYYWMDVTWDDFDLEDYPNTHSYWYFNVSDDDFTDHKSEPMIMEPDCTQKMFSFYEMEDAYMKTYSFDGFSDIVTKQNDKHSINVKFSSESEMNKAVSELIKKGKVKEIPSLSDKEVYCNYSKEQCCITLSIK